MASCCDEKSCEVTALLRRHRKLLIVVLIINTIMFFIEGAYGWLSHSTALMADALDMLGDALVYSLSLYVLAKSNRQQAGVSLFKGVFMLVFGLMVLIEAGCKIFHPILPNVEIMGMVGLLALIANLVCFFLLYSHREDNLNMSSTWLCSRNDLVANTGVLVAALLSYLLVSRWPDIFVGVMIAMIFLQSAVFVIKQSLIEIKQ